MAATASASSGRASRIQTVAPPLIGSTQPGVSASPAIRDTAAARRSSAEARVFSARANGKGGAEVVGLDYSRFLLTQNPHAGLICGDATRLPFPDESFDVTFEANVL